MTSWESLRSRVKAIQVRGEPTWPVYVDALVGVILAVGLVFIYFEPASPATRILFAVAASAWSAATLIRWRRVTWAKRTAALGCAVFIVSQLLLIGLTNSVAGRLFLAAAILIWSTIPLIQRRRTTLTGRLVAVSGFVFTAGLILFFFGSSGRVVGHYFLSTAIFALSVLPAILWWRQTWTKRILAVSATIFLMIGGVDFLVGSPQNSLANVASWTIVVLLDLAILLFFGAQVSRVTALSATRVLVALTVVFLFCFPPLLAFLATNGGVDFIHILLQEFNSKYSWLGIVQYLLQASVPILLIVFPEMVRRRLPGNGKSARVYELVPVQLASVAALATGLYALTLHFAHGPLAKVSANQLAFATIAVVVLLSPIYRYIAKACWERGIAEVFDPGDWLSRQKELIKIFRTAFDESAGSGKLDSSSADTAAASAAAADATITGSAGSNPS